MARSTAHIWMLLLPSLYLQVVSIPKDPSCSPLFTTFPPGSVSHDTRTSLFIPTSGVSSSGYRIPSSGGGVELFLRKPNAEIRTKDGVNDNIADGATLNGTHLTLYGRFTIEVSGPRVPGVVTAAVLIAPEGDEIDIEILGGDPDHWQSNVFVPHASDKEPLYGVFGGIHSYDSTGDQSPTPNSVDAIHTYVIDWNAERIVWIVDDKTVRTLFRKDTVRNGQLHFPSHAARVQLGIWDASSPAGTAEWARGPIDWKTAPAQMRAHVKSVRIECLGMHTFG